MRGRHVHRCLGKQIGNDDESDHTTTDVHLFELRYAAVSRSDGYFTESNVKSVFGWSGQVAKQRSRWAD